jgi:hypothetical protein
MCRDKTFFVAPLPDQAFKCKTYHWECLERSRPDCVAAPELRCSRKVLRSSEKVLRLDLQGGPTETGWGLPTRLSMTNPCPRKWKLFWSLFLRGTWIVGMKKLRALVLINNLGNLFLHHCTSFILPLNHSHSSRSSSQSVPAGCGVCMYAGKHSRRKARKEFSGVVTP